MNRKFTRERVHSVIDFKKYTHFSIINTPDIISSFNTQSFKMQDY